MRFYVTDQLKSVELDSVILGIPSVKLLDQIIPPKLESFTTYGYCTPDCTKHLPPQGITIFAVYPHSHLAGKQIFLRHYRNGKQLPDIVSDKYYDFNYQVRFDLHILHNYDC